MELARERPKISAEEYLELERAAPTKSELFCGEMFAMAGVTEAHDLLAGNFYALLSQQFRGRPCRAHTSDMKVRAKNWDSFFYPDVSALCGDSSFSDLNRDALLNPSVIVEVLSRSTESFDRGDKFTAYRTLSSLQEYVLVSQWRPHIEIYRRVSAGRWELEALDGTEGEIVLPSVNASISLSDLFDKVTFTNE